MFTKRKAGEYSPVRYNETTYHRRVVRESELCLARGAPAIRNTYATAKVRPLHHWRNQLFYPSSPCS
eukprot:301157-Prorocentrum_minimum.AAC.1